MRISTLVSFDMETYEILERESYEYSGPVELCKASGAQNTISGEQQQFYSTLTNDYSTQFANQSSILKSLTGAFAPIINAGPGQQGFSAPEQAAMRTSAMDTSAQAYQNASAAVNERMAAQGGGNAYLPSGASAQVNAALAQGAAQQNAAQQQNITMQNYATGRQNFMNAAGALSGAAGMYNPEGFMGGATNAGNAAFGSATQIQEENSAWQGELGGALAGLGETALMGPLAHLGSGSGSGSGN